MEGDTFKAFAYGSNMLTARLRERCPSARALGAAELRGYELRWHKKSQDGSGKCDILPTDRPGASVSGVLYKIATDEKRALDTAEGLNAGYKEIDVHVMCNGSETSAKAYRATNIDTLLKPYTWYRALVVAGAKEHDFSVDYVERLEAAPADQDPDTARHDKYMALISEVRA